GLHNATRRRGYSSWLPSTNIGAALASCRHPGRRGGAHVRGRKPEALRILSADIAELERTAHSDTSPWCQVLRPRIVLGISAGQRREGLAAQLECDESTIWRACQRYRHLGLAGLLADHRFSRSGRPPEITPLQKTQIVDLVRQSFSISFSISLASSSFVG